jgi:hypothetical protein
MASARKYTDDEFGFAPAWQPKPGDVLSGLITHITFGVSTYGRYPIVTIKEANNESFSLHAFHTILVNQLIALRPKVGEEIVIKFFGKKPTKVEGQEAALYGVMMPDREAADVWGPSEEPIPYRPAPAESDVDDLTQPRW